MPFIIMDNFFLLYLNFNYYKKYFIKNKYYIIIFKMCYLKNINIFLREYYNKLIYFRIKRK